MPLELILPGVQQLPLALQFPPQFANVFAGLHPFDGLPFELLCMSTPPCHLGHFASIRCKMRLFGVSQFWGSLQNAKKTKKGHDGGSCYGVFFLGTRDEESM